MVQLLLQAGADVNAAAKDGLTALIYAGAKGHVDVVQLLLQAGAHVNAEDTNGHAEIARLLKEAAPQK